MKRTGLWNSLERWIRPATVLAEWREVLDGEFVLAEKFLHGTDEPAEEYPCQHLPRCGCQHEVIHHSAERIVAACRCEERGCRSFPLRREEILIHELDGRKMCAAIRAACEFEPSPDDDEQVKGATGTWAAGTFGDLASPVYLTIRQTEKEFLAEIERLLSREREPFIVLAPTDRHWTATARSALQRQRCAFIPLGRHLAWDGAGKFKANESLKAVLERFRSGLATAASTIGRCEDEPKSRFVFHKVGQSWKVVFDGGPEIHIRDTFGARYLDYLLHRPNESVSAYDLELAIRPEKAKARVKTSIQSNLDADAVKDYLRQLNKLRAKREHATDDGDQAEVDRIDGEIEAIEAELNRNGEASDTGERARGNVSKAIAAVRQRLLKGDKHEREFGEHLERFVDTGYECIYNQPQGRIWG